MTTSDDYNQSLENLMTLMGQQFYAAIEHLLEARARQAWQDGHDTALINGQSQNPHDKENQ